MADYLRLADILDGDNRSIVNLKKQLETNGWCVVQLTPALSKIVDDSVESFDDFFSKNRSYKDTFSGYLFTNHKERIRLLTCDRFKDNTIPSHKTTFHNLCSQLDSTMNDLISVISEPIILNTDSRKEGQSPLTLQALDVPFLKNAAQSPEGPESRDDDEDKRFCLVDVAHYFNRKDGKGTLIDPTLNCCAHYDPGLLTFSLLSTSPGLELQELSSKEWISPPFDDNIGVLWCGLAASEFTNNRLKACIHRVKYYPNDSSRLTVWLEMCTNEQIKPVETDVTIVNYFHEDKQVPIKITRVDEKWSVHLGDDESSIDTIYGALGALVDGNAAVSIGYEALLANTTGAGKTAVGIHALGVVLTADERENFRIGP